MKTYNKIMQIFWLSIGIIIIIAVTYKGFTEGFDRWMFYYIFAMLALFVFLIRRFMMKRMIKHQQFMDQQNKNKK